MKLVKAASILLKDMTFVGRAGVPFVWSTLQIDVWWDPLHMVHMALPFFAHCRRACPRLRQRKHLFVAFNFSILSVVLFVGSPGPNVLSFHRMRKRRLVSA